MDEAKKHSAGRGDQALPARGIVICPPVQIAANSLHVLNPRIDPQELRFALLFWDELVWPTSNLIHIPAGPEEQFLEAAGILKRPKLQMQGRFKGAEMFTAPHLQVFKELDAAEPNKWSLARGDRSFNWKEEPLNKSNGAVLQLHRAIPVPTHDAPLEEILEFKTRRSDEVRMLRAEIDSYVAQAAVADDLGAALIERAQHVERACIDLLRAGNAWQFPVRIADLKASLEFRPGDALWKGLQGSAISEFALQFDAVTTLMIGLGFATAGMVMFSLKLTGAPSFQSVVDRTTPFQYVASFHDEIF